MNIRLYNYYKANVLASTQAIQLDQVSRDCTNSIVQGIKTGVPYTQVTLANSYLDNIADVHCDKWVEETATHMFLYSSAQQPQLATPQTMPTGTPAILQDQIIQYKSFSGDVSGVIGESIFASILRMQFGLQEDDFAHFRGDKSTGVFPDFGIFSVSQSLQSQLNWDGNSTIHAFVPAEVKAVTNLSASIIRPRIRKAIQQIQQFWIVTNSTGASIICVAIRNQSQRSYDVAILWIR